MMGGKRIKRGYHVWSPAASGVVCTADEAGKHWTELSGELCWRGGTLPKLFYHWNPAWFGVLFRRLNKQTLAGHISPERSREMLSTSTLNTMQGRADGVNPRIARVNDDGSVNRNWTNRDNDNRNLRFRPAAIDIRCLKLPRAARPVWRQTGWPSWCSRCQTDGRHLAGQR